MLELKDKIAIMQQHALYCHICDSEDWSRLDEVYTSDVEVDRTAYGYEMTYGTDAVRASFGVMPLPPAHLISTIYIYEEKGEVRSKAKIHFPGPNSEFLVSDVEDTWVSTGDGWRISKRLFKPLGLLKSFAADQLDKS